MKSNFASYASLLIVISFFQARSVPAGPQTLGPLNSIPATEFLHKMTPAMRAFYVGGVIDGFTFTSYGYSLPEHDQFVRCARAIPLGKLSEETVAWIRSHPMSDESAASAVAATMGDYCKRNGFR
jgi:hypothetical protein